MSPKDEETLSAILTGYRTAAIAVLLFLMGWLIYCFVAWAVG